MEIGGLPLHPLVVHAAVVLTPLAVLSVTRSCAGPGTGGSPAGPALALTVAAAGAWWWHD